MFYQSIKNRFTILFFVLSIATTSLTPCFAFDQCNQIFQVKNTKTETIENTIRKLIFLENEYNNLDILESRKMMTLSKINNIRKSILKIISEHSFFELYQKEFNTFKQMNKVNNDIKINKDKIKQKIESDQQKIWNPRAIDFRSDTIFNFHVFTTNGIQKIIVSTEDKLHFYQNNHFLNQKTFPLNKMESTNKIELSKDQKKFAFGTNRGDIYILDENLKVILHTETTNFGIAISHLQFINNNQIAYMSGRKLFISDLQNVLIDEFPLPNFPNSFIIHNNQSFVYSAFNNKIIQKLDLKNKLSVMTSIATDSVIERIIFSKDENHIYASTENGQLLIYDLNLNLVDKVDFGLKITYFEKNFKGNVLAVGLANNDIQFVLLPTLQKITYHHHEVPQTFSFTHDDQFLIVGSHSVQNSITTVKLKGLD